jgi:hypothetical protein
MRELQFRPIAAWRMDDDTPIQDYSGYGRTFTRTGTEYKGIALTSTADYSQMFDSTHTGSFTLPNFRVAGTEGQTSSFTATLLPADTTGAARIRRTDSKEVFTLTRDTLTYSLDYAVGGEDFSIDFEVNKKLDLAVTWTQNAIEVYINDQHVYSHEIPLVNRGAVLTATNTWTIETDVGYSLLVNNVCFYRVALTNIQVDAIYKTNNDVSPENTAKTFGGVVIPVGQESLKPFFTKVWDTDTEWDSGKHSSTESDDNQLHPRMVSGLSIESEWLASVSFSDPITFPTFQWADVWYDGTNIENVEASLDGVTWSAVTLGAPLSIITAGFNPQNKTIQFRVSFAAGLENAYLEYLRLNVYSTNTVTMNEGRTITYTSPVVMYPVQAIEEFRANWGMYSNGGTISISADPAQAPTNPMTVELWIKPTSDTTYSTGLTTNLTNTYVNGLSATALNDQWQVIHKTYSSAIAGVMAISGHFTLGKVVFYPTILTQAQCAQIVRANTGTVTTTVNASVSIALSEPATPATSHAHDWQTLSGN